VLFLPLTTTFFLSSPPRSLTGRTCSALFSNFDEEKTKAIIKKE
jgi:hypothetical protein